ncbi:MAG: AAA family ATPase [Armatimonas sp.]
MRWNLRLLGTFSLERDGQEIRRFRYQKAALLLAYLALNRHRAHPREFLIEFLWPEEDPETARNRFRVLLTSLRHQLEPPGVTPGSILSAPTPATLQLAPDLIQTDVAEFEAALRRRDFVEAKALYTGPLLPEFYEDWVIQERDRLEQLAQGIPQNSHEPVASLTPPARPTSSSLPIPLTRFFGREAELGQLQALLMQYRLLTLIGPGGAGKTRLSLQLARAWEEETGGVTYFVPLVERFEPTQILDALRSAIGLSTPAENESPFSQLVQYLSQRPALLVLDNFEQLVASGGAIVIEQLLASSPSLRCLVTSRRALGIAGEREFPVEPLPLPPQSASLPEFAQSPTVALFLDRASALRPDFTLTPQNVEAVIAICRKLEGLPLALELAAARLRASTPAQIRDGLEHRFDLLTRQERWAAKENRHSSLRLAVDWSWHLLSPPLQQFFAQLSVFKGGWSAEAASEITDTPNAAAALENLAADSLIQTEPGGETMRFRMLETLREFAQERLMPEQRESLPHRHAMYFLEWIERIDTLRTHAVISPLSTWLDRVLPEIENLRAALAFFQAQEDAESEARLVGAASFLWIHLGMMTEIERFVAAAEARYTQPTPIRAFLLYRASWVAQRTGDWEKAQQRSAECLALYETTGDPVYLAMGWNSVGNAAFRAGDLSTARDAFERAVSYGKDARPAEFSESTVYHDIPASNLSEVLLLQGENETAYTVLSELLQRERSAGIQHGSGVFRNYILATRRLGHTQEAERLWRQHLQESASTANHFGILEALTALAELAQERGNTERAVQLSASLQCLQEEATQYGLHALSAGKAQALAEAIRLALAD